MEQDDGLFYIVLVEAGGLLEEELEFGEGAHARQLHDHASFFVVQVLLDLQEVEQALWSEGIEVFELGLWVEDLKLAVLQVL